MATYSEKLKDPRWQKKRLEVFERDNWMCVKCGDAKNTLHVHHKIYFNNTSPWDYDSIHLETLCLNCHSEEHKAISEAVEPERKYEHMLIGGYSDNTLIAINAHIDTLKNSLLKNLPIKLETEIMKNIIFLQNKRKEYLNG